LDNWEYWLEVWERKGSLQTDDLREVDGYEHTSIVPENAAKGIIEALDIRKEDRVLEVGCGAGMLAQYIDCDYVGIDYSRPMVKKHIEILGNSVLFGYADDLIFKDKSFDKVFSYGVFHYFPDKAYAFRAISEMIRVAKKSIFIGDLPFDSPRKEHLLFRKEEFDAWDVTDGFYNELRFNAFLNVGA